MIHEPKIQIESMFSCRARGISSSAVILPRLKVHTPRADCASCPPHAAKTRSFHAKLAVMKSGVCGRVMKLRLRPLRRSYVCRLRPTEVVSWKVVFPSGILVKGTEVGETNPTVCRKVSVGVVARISYKSSSYPIRRKKSGCANLSLSLGRNGNLVCADSLSLGDTAIRDAIHVCR